MGGFLDRLVRADLGKRLYGLLPEQRLERLADPPISGMAEGHGGMIRGWGLEYGETAATGVTRPALPKGATSRARQINIGGTATHQSVSDHSILFRGIGFERHRGTGGSTGAEMFSSWPRC